MSVTAKNAIVYRCSLCKAAYCKLWREYSTFLNHQRLYCVVCALKDQGVEGPVTPDGKVASRIGLTDKIGNLVPAVPDEENQTFWGYSSTPQAGVDWWKALPLRKP